jgi:hypothetical protein
VDASTRCGLKMGFRTVEKLGTSFYGTPRSKLETCSKDYAREDSYARWLIFRNYLRSLTTPTEVASLIRFGGILSAR